MENTPRSQQFLLVHDGHTPDAAPRPLQNMAHVLESHGFCVSIITVEGFIATIAANETTTAPAFVVAFGIGSVGVVQALNGTQVPVLWWLCDGVTKYSSTLLRQCPHHLFSNVTVAAAGPWAMRAITQRCPQYCVEELLPPTPRLVETIEPSPLLATHGETMTFALIGPISPAHAQDVLLQATTLLEDDVQRCRFVFAGVPEHQALYEELNHAATNTSRILLLPHADVSDWWSLLNEADVIICAVRDDPMPEPAMHACRLAKTIVCSNHTSMAPLLEARDAGLVFDSDDASALATCIHTILNAPPSKRQTWGQNARRLHADLLSEEAFWQRLSEHIDATQAHAALLDEEQRNLAAGLRKLETQLLELVDREAHSSAHSSVVIIPDYEHTLSWQITKPLRAVKQLLGIKASAYELLSNLGRKHPDRRSIAP